MRIFLIVITLSIFCISAYCIEFNKKQYENLGYIHDELIKKYPNFQGFNGSKKSMHVIGLSEEIAKQEIDKMDIDELINNNPKKKRLKKLIQKLKSNGFDDDDLKAFNLISNGD
jgi:hypothetical protein